ncbi:unnamed protein product, partial [Medioppia subpectinata]
MRQLHDNQRIDAEVNTCVDQMTDRRSGQSSMRSTVGTQTSDSIEDIIGSDEDRPIDNIIGSKELAVVSDTRQWDPIDVMPNECQSESLINYRQISPFGDTGDEDNKSVTFAAFYESIGGQRSDTESTPEPHIQHMNTTSGVESEDNTEEHSDSNGSNGSSNEVMNGCEESGDCVDVSDIQTTKTITDSQSRESEDNTEDIVNENLTDSIGSTNSPHNVVTDLYTEDSRRPIDGRPKDKPYKCHFIGCGKAFKQSNALLRHRLIHSGDKPYKCPIDGCDYRCRQRQQLSAHTNRHLGVRPYACAVQTCRKAFLSKHHLREHRLVYSDARPHPCPHPRCTQRFKTPSNLRNHWVAVHQ